MPIHETGVIDPRAEIDPSAELGPYVVVSGPVRIGPRTVVDPYALLTGATEIGAACRIHAGAVIGDVPQDRAYAGGESFCRIGERTIIREGVTIHRGTAPGSTTQIGSGCFLMANSHVGHNCTLGDEVVLVNGALLGGYVEVGDGAVISGNAAVHQFCRVGELAMISGLAKVTRDVPPFLMTDRDGLCVGVNTVGLRRGGYSAAERELVKQAYRILYRSSLSTRGALEKLELLTDSIAVQRLIAFLRTPSRRGLTAGAKSRVGARDSE